MILWHTFIESIQLPRKQSLFKLNRTGMDTAVIYMFILLLLASIPSLIDRIMTGSSMNIQLFFLIIYFFIFYYLPFVIIYILLLSILAYICLLITKIMKRKLRYSILWKMCAYTTTVPLVIYTVLALFFPVPALFFWLSLLYTLILLIKMISIYPQRKDRTN